MSADFHAQIASIMEVLANAAVAEICKVVEDGYQVVNLEMSRSKKENESLRRKVKLLELLVARYRAERGKESSMVSRWSGVRLLNRQDREGPSLQGLTRCLNRDPGTQQSMQKIMPMNLHQDADQEVTKTKPAEPEEEGELLIIKVEGTMETPTTNQEVPADACTSSKGDTHAATSLPATLKDTRRPEGQRCLKNTSSAQCMEEKMHEVQACKEDTGGGGQVSHRGRRRDGTLQMHLTQLLQGGHSGRRRGHTRGRRRDVRKA